MRDTPQPPGPATTTQVAAQVAATVLASAKYRNIDPTLIEALVARELATGARPKDAAKAVKSKLHQVAGAYQVEPLQGEAWLAEVHECVQQGADLRPLCRAQMARHASTRERLPILDEFYGAIFAGLPPVRSVLDLACGLNPLALPWMALPAGATYWACDIYADQVDLLNSWFAQIGQRGEAFLCDLVSGHPTRQADVVLLLKAIPCLQQVDREIGRRLLDTIDTPTLIVSYPAQSLGGRKHGMPEQYAAQFARLVEGRPWQIDTFQFSTELVFSIRR
jgi:16S rRNA (guanine(1405)-N(7))-methyltransferase